MFKELKLTGYPDIDELLIKTYNLLIEGELMKDYNGKPLKWKPKYYERPLKRELKLTGYSDVDELLIKTHYLLKEGEN